MSWRVVSCVNEPLLEPASVDAVHEVTRAYPRELPYGVGSVLLA